MPFESGFELYVMEGHERGRWFALRSRKLIIGRGEDSGTLGRISINDPTVSKTHATMNWDDNRMAYSIANESKTNSTLVNGHVIHEETQLAPNDVIKMGHVVFRLTVSGSQATGRLSTRPRTNLLSVDKTMRIPKAEPMRETQARVVIPPPPARVRLKRDDAVLFFGHLSVMLKAGIPLVRAMEALASQATDPSLAWVAASMAERLNAGQSMGAAMESFGGVFSALESNLVRAGEHVGDLPAVFKRLADWVEKDIALTRKVKGSLSYPLTVFGAGILLVLFLGKYVFTVMLPFLTSSGMKLPPMTQALVTITQILGSPIFLIISTGVVVLLAYVGRVYMRGPRYEMARDGLILFLPLFGTLARKMATARFCRTLGLLYSSGIPIISAVEVAATCGGNVIINRKAREAVEPLKRGQTLSDSIAQSDFFPSSLISLVSVG